MKYIEEKIKKVEVVGEYDVIVCGGGTAGFPAAIAAARAGAKVAVIERYGFLGGVPAYCIMPAWHRIEEYHSDMLAEFCNRVAGEKESPNPLENRHGEPEYVKKAALEMAVEAGVDLILHSLIVDVVMDGNTVQGVITESKSGRRAYLAKVIIDATGDGDVAVMAGADYMLGNEEGVTQGMTVRFRIGDIDFERYLDWVAEHRQYYHNISDEKIAFFRQASREGREFIMYAVLTDYYRLFDKTDEKLPVLGYFNASSIRKNELSINATRVYGLDGTKQEDLSAAEVECRQQEYALYEFLRKHVPGFEHAKLIETAPQIGVRETRRIVGEHILTEQECRDRVDFEDTVVLNPIGFDLHDKTYSCLNYDTKARIPYRCLLPKGVRGILTAGRCISSDHVANSSVRRMHTSFDTGQTAGIAAAMAAQKGVAPSELPFAELKEKLVACGCLKYNPAEEKGE